MLKKEQPSLFSQWPNTHPCQHSSNIVATYNTQCTYKKINTFRSRSPMCSFLVIACVGDAPTHQLVLPCDSFNVEISTHEVAMLLVSLRRSPWIHLSPPSPRRAERPQLIPNSYSPLHPQVSIFLTSIIVLIPTSRFFDTIVDTMYSPIYRSNIG